MKVFFLFFFLVSFGGVTFGFQEANPTITVDLGTVTPNQVAVMRITVSNPLTAETLWKNTIRIEETPPNFQPVKKESALSHEIRPGQTAIGELTFQVLREAEAGTYQMTISLSGGVGTCQEGCVPYFIEKSVTIKVVRDEPDLVITHTLQGDTLIITLRNVGTGKAESIICDGVTAGSLSPGEKKDVTLGKKSALTVTYEDTYGKKFTRSYTVAEKTQPPEKKASAQVILVLVGMVLYALRSDLS